jgi:DNA polymerase III epsilon subunit-like protein
MGADIQDGALKVNGLTRDQLNQFPDRKLVTQEILKFLDDNGGKFYLRAHNAQFDRDFFYHFLSGQGLHHEYVKRFRPVMQCTYEKAKKVFAKQKAKPENMKLGTLCKWFNIPLDNAHEALSDAKPLVKLWDALDAMEGFKIPTSIETNYIQPKYLQINVDGSVYISKEATTNKDALDAVLREIHETFST